MASTVRQPACPDIPCGEGASVVVAQEGCLAKPLERPGASNISILNETENPHTKVQVQGAINRTCRTWGCTHVAVAFTRDVTRTTHSTTTEHVVRGSSVWLRRSCLQSLYAIPFKTPHGGSSGTIIHLYNSSPGWSHHLQI